jgi:hypothetical protein
MVRPDMSPVISPSLSGHRLPANSSANAQILAREQTSKVRVDERFASELDRRRKTLPFDRLVQHLLHSCKAVLGRVKLGFRRVRVDDVSQQVARRALSAHGKGPAGEDRVLVRTPDTGNGSGDWTLRRIQQRCGS